ncbi:MAG: hypothetical protein E7337_03825 [Clostridiales bacterium]|nr:hypothetical protein [Clostridiales bacterium]
MRAFFKNVKHVYSALALSMVFTAIHVLYLYVGLAEIRPDPPVKADLLPLLMLPAMFVALLLFFNGADRSCRAARECGVVASGRTWLSYFAALLFFWLPYYIMCFPGGVFLDTSTAISYGIGIDRTVVHNPYMQILLFSGVYRFGALLGDPTAGIAIYDTIQFLCYAALLSYALCLVLGSPRLRLVLAAVYALVPFFPIYALCMGKDTNFALAILLDACLMLQLVRDGEAFLQRPWKPVSLTLSLILISFFRNNVIYVPVAALLIHALFVDRTARVRQFAAVACLGALLIGLGVPKLFGAPKVPIRESLSIPLQQTGYIFSRYEEDVTEEELALITNAVPRSAIERYDPEISDPIKDQFAQYPTSEQLRGYFEAWRRQLLRHPLAYLKAAYLQNFAYYTPLAERTSIKPHVTVGFDLSQWFMPATGYEPPVNPYHEYVRRLDDIALHVPVYSLFSKIGLYTWLTVIAVVRLFQLQRKRYIAAFAAPLMVMVGCLFTPVNGYFRYAFPMIAAAPIMLGCALSLSPASDEAARPVGAKRAIGLVLKAASVLALGAGIAAVMVSSVDSSTVHLPEGDYTLSPVAADGRCLAAPPTDEKGTQLQTADSADEAARVHISYTEDGEAVFHFPASDKTLDVDSDLALAGNGIWAYTDNGLPSQHWRILGTDRPDEYLICFRADLAAAFDPEDGACTLEKRSDSLYRRWRIVPAANE